MVIDIPRVREKRQQWAKQFSQNCSGPAAVMAGSLQSAGSGNVS